MLRYLSTQAKHKDKMLPSNYLTASQAHALVKSGDLTVDQVIGDHRQRIEERDKDVLAWTSTNFITPEGSITKELCGTTIGVKDIMSRSSLAYQLVWS
jgi:Asp-tRNA(Asn)/Glu-tRNA(Gln) amidotransferase A subunit family amidase